MKLCIAEKPSVAREIAFILGARKKHNGYFEGNGYCVSWTFGHLCGLKTPDDYKASWKRWELDSLPIIPKKFEIKLVGNKSAKQQFSVIKNLCKQAEMVINCGDAGQEGELIQRWVIQHAKYKGPVQRLWISSLTPEAIRDGFQNLKPASQFDNLYHAGSSRAIGDWLLGMNATRLYTLKYGGFKQLLSIGRVQTPTLAMLVERHKEIENFVPQPFWELQTTYRATGFNCEKGRFLKKEDGAALLIKVTGQPFTILSVTKKNGLEYPPKLFDLTSLQVNCNKRFSYSADQTLKIVQKLYEQKLVTYPRVDTTYLPDDVYPKVPGILKKMTNYSQFTSSLLGKKIKKSAKVFNNKKVTDHHAIIPTGVQKSLPLNEQKVYDAIARRFIAAFYPNCEVAHTTVIGESAGVKFKATGKEILKEGWRVLYPKPAKTKAIDPEGENDKKSAEEKILPNFTKGETGPHTPELLEKKTQPPKNYTEATLLRSMETAGKKVDDDELRELMKANGIGRPSTRANIIETLFRRKYVQRKKKAILPTETGIQLIDTIQNNLLKSAELTGQWEKQLREIEAGSFEAAEFIGNMKTMVNGLVTEVRMAKHKSRIAAPERKVASPRKSNPRKKTDPIPGLGCPKCRKGKILKGKTAYGCSRWKEGCVFRLPFEYKQKKLPQTQLARLMKMGSTIQLKGFKENGKSLNGKLRFDSNFILHLEGSAVKPRKPRKSSRLDQCPKCKKGTVLKGKTAYGCSRWKEGCDFKFPFEEIRKKVQGRTITKELIWSILRGDI